MSVVKLKSYQLFLTWICYNRAELISMYMMPKSSKNIVFITILLHEGGRDIMQYKDCKSCYKRSE